MWVPVSVTYVVPVSVTYVGACFSDMWVPVSVTKLTVSAGESKVLQLPEKSVTLSAFVLPKAEDGKASSQCLCLWYPRQRMF